MNDKWISVKEKVSPLDEIVLVASDRGEVREGMYQAFGYMSGVKGRVTHWRPMPKPPQEVSE